MTEDPKYEELRRRIQELERNRIELMKSKDELDRMFSMVLDMICVSDLQTSSFIKVNQAFTKTLGYSEQELLGKPLFDFIHPDDLESTRMIFEKRLQAGMTATNFENRCRCRDGNYKWLGWVSHPDIRKGITYAIARDITLIKQTERRLIEKEKRYRSLFNYSNDGICLHEIIYDGDRPVDYRILDINPKYEAYTRITREDAVGSLGSDLYKTHPAPYLEVFAEVARTGEPTTFETYFPPLDKHFLISVFSPREHRFATIFRDITEQKNIEKELIESENRYRSLFHSHHAVMLLIDPDSGDILDANPAAVSYYGWPYNDMVKKRISDINILTEAQVRREMDNARKDLRNVFNFKHRLADGSIRDVEVYSAPITIQEKQLLYSIIHDVTDRKRAEEERTQLISELQEALGEIKTLRGILPICASCKKIRDDRGYWNLLEAYLHEHSDVKFSHGICPDCVKKLYPGYTGGKGPKTKISGGEP